MNKVSFEATPNPATLKFLLGRRVTEEGFDCPTASETDRSPLAAKIFGFPWTAGVYIGPDFVTVTKADWVEWNVLGAPLAGLIEEHLERGEPVAVAGRVRGEHEPLPTDSAIVQKIKEVLNRDIRPVVALDGGDILFDKFEDGVVHLHMKGACAGCPSSSATLKDGVEVRLKELIPEIREVVAV